jgi:hypothetical protein
MNQQMVTELADDNGQIEVEPTPDVSFDPTIDIRDEEFQLFESKDNRLYIKTPEMPQELFVEVIPTSEGATTQPTTEVVQDELEICEPAEREESPDVTARESHTVVMD